MAGKANKQSLVGCASRTINLRPGTGLIYAPIYNDRFLFITFGRMGFLGPVNGARCAPYDA
jgi:hypothetical protein